MSPQLKILVGHHDSCAPTKNNHARARLHWQTRARLHWYTRAWLHWYTRARLHWYTWAHDYTDTLLHTRAQLHWYTRATHTCKRKRHTHAQGQDIHTCARDTHMCARVTHTRARVRHTHTRARDTHTRACKTLISAREKHTPHFKILNFKDVWKYSFWKLHKKLVYLAKKILFSLPFLILWYNLARKCLILLGTFRYHWLLLNTTWKFPVLLDTI